MTLATSGSALRRYWAALISALVLVAVVFAPSSSDADITASDFPPKASIKSELNGRGHWSIYTSRVAETLGSKPSDCSSDDQMLNFQEDRVRFYTGRERGMSASVSGNAAIAIYRYASRSEARQAVKRNASYPKRCPRVTEWVCNDCDGVSTTWRTRVTARRVGQQSVTWKFRSEGNFKHNGFCVVARRGKSVVRVEVGRSRDPSSNHFSYPPLTKRAKALRVARIALSAAT